MREIIHIGKTHIIDAELSKMTFKQRQAMDSLNTEAKKRLAERVQWDNYDAKQQEEKTMTPETPINTPAVDAIVSKEFQDTPERTLEEQMAIDAGPLRYTQDTLAVEFDRVFKEEIMALRNAGRKEYAHDASSPFANFERAADDMGIDRKQVLWVYAMKHKDGIAGHLKGHTSQREDVRGRINDLIVYLLLLRGMINEEVGSEGLFGLGDLG